MSQHKSIHKRCAACGTETDELFDHYSERKQKYYDLCEECIVKREDDGYPETKASSFIDAVSFVLSGFMVFVVVAFTATCVTLIIYNQ